MFSEYAKSRFTREEFTLLPSHIHLILDFFFRFYKFKTVNHLHYLLHETSDCHVLPCTFVSSAVKFYYEDIISFNDIFFSLPPILPPYIKYVLLHFTTYIFTLQFEITTKEIRVTILPNFWLLAFKAYNQILSTLHAAPPMIKILMVRPNNIVYSTQNK